jgi:CubicO group peptidase (beta-lactamase class C family)
MTSRLYSLSLLALLACGGIGLSGCGNLSSVRVPEDADATGPHHFYAEHHDLKELVDHLALPKIKNDRHVGIVVGVIDEDERQHVFGYGETEKGSGISPDGSTIFGIGSLTKCFTELLLQDLVSDGTLTLTETISEILSQEKEFSDDAKAITLAQLATHTSGLPRQPNDFAMLSNLLKYSFTGKNIYSHINEKVVYDFLRGFHPDTEDKGAYHYSNIGMGLLGHLIEVKTGKSLRVLMDERVLQSIGLKNTSYVVGDEKTTHMATGYVGSSPVFLRRNTPVPNWRMDRFLDGAAGLYSTVDDLLVFAQYHLNQPPPPRFQFPVNHTIFDIGDRRHQSLGGGWEIDEFGGGEVIHFMYGVISGYSAYIGIEYDDRMAVIVLYNNFDWDEEIGHDLLLTLTRNKRARWAEGTKASPHSAEVGMAQGLPTN